MVPKLCQGAPAGPYQVTLTPAKRPLGFPPVFIGAQSLEGRQRAGMSALPQVCSYVARLRQYLGLGLDFEIRAGARSQERPGSDSRPFQACGGWGC